MEFVPANKIKKKKKLMTPLRPVFKAISCLRWGSYPGLFKSCQKFLCLSFFFILELNGADFAPWI